MTSIQIEYTPVYELITSLAAFLHKRTHKTLELGPDWVSRVRKQLAPALAVELSTYKEMPKEQIHLLHLLALQRQDLREVEPFLDWLAALSPGEIYERVAPHQRPGALLVTQDLGEFRDRWASILRGWHQQYFQTVDMAVLDHLQADAESLRALAEGTPPVELVAQVMGAVVAVPPDVTRIVLIPHHHFRPINLFEHFRDVLICHYAAADMPGPEGEPPPRMRRLILALADDSRLRMLRFISKAPRTLTELAGLTGLTPGTVYHHLVVLRSAGLVQVGDLLVGSSGARYTFRAAALSDLNLALGDFLKGE